MYGDEYLAFAYTVDSTQHFSFQCLKTNGSTDGSPSNASGLTNLPMTLNGSTDYSTGSSPRSILMHVTPTYLRTKMYLVRTRC